MDDILDDIQERVNQMKEQAMDSNAKAIGAGFGSVVGFASLAGEVSVAAEVGAGLAAVTGVTVAAPIVALGLGYLAYKACGGFARMAIRQLDHQINSDSDRGGE